MTKDEDFIILEPYQPTEDERLAIKELEDKGLKPSHWNSKKKHILSFKKNLRDDMYEKQNMRYAYCRIHVPKACVPMHREHIVDKDEHPRWMFLPDNLCVSCPWCNDWKKTTEVLVDPQAEDYPRSSDGFKIIHPLYDRYSDHIELIGDVLYRGKTDKGIFTIKACHLYRVDLAEERVDMKMLAENKGSIIAELIGLIRLPESYVDNREKFNKIVIGIVDKYRQSHAKAVSAQ